MREFLIEELVAARHQDALTVIGPQLAEAVEHRDKLAERLTILKGQIIELQAVKERVEGQLVALADERTQTVLSGGSPLKTAGKRRKLEAELEDIVNALADLQAAVEQTTSEGQTAHETVFDLWCQCQAAYREGNQATFAQRVRELGEYQVTYFQGLQRAYADIMRPGAFPDFRLHHPRGSATRPCLPLYLGRDFSLYALRDHVDVALVGAGADLLR